MTEPMHILFEYLSEKGVLRYWPKQRGHRLSVLLEEQQEALTDTLTDSQKALWDQYYDTQMDYHILYEQALFQAAFALAKELR